MRRAAAALAAVLVLAVPGAALAQCPKTTRGDIEDEVMCPVCGTSLATAGDTQPLADQQRDLIDRLIAQCRSKEQIKSVLVAQYGESVLAEPEKEGFGLTTYLVPALAFLAGAAAVLFAWVRWRRGRSPSPLAPAASAPPADAARLDDDMARYDL